MALFISRPALAAELDPKDPQATALGYVVDASEANKVKFPKYTIGQDCATCQRHQGKAGDASGNCALCAGETVAASARCGAFAQQA